VGPRAGLDAVVKRRESNRYHPILQPVASCYTSSKFLDRNIQKEHIDHRHRGYSKTDFCLQYHRCDYEYGKRMAVRSNISKYVLHLKFVVFWAASPRAAAVGYQRFGEKLTTNVAKIFTLHTIVNYFFLSVSLNKHDIEKTFKIKIVILVSSIFCRVHILHILCQGQFIAHSSRQLQVW
jgi:hypothetical protein